MKKIVTIILVIFGFSKILAQSSQTNTTQEITENINTLNNFTSINLYTIDFGGQKIPLNLVYDHSGVKVNSKPSIVGTSWSIENIGYINRVINDYPDSHPTKGWFNTTLPDLTPYDIYASCNDNCPQNNGDHPDNDLSPDFFSCSLFNGLNFDFIYKKNSNGLPIPVFISNPDGTIINTNFSNFVNDCQVSNTNTVFNIVDKYGFKYDFINGPNLYEASRYKQSQCRNNYYLKTISDVNNTNLITIQYDPYILVDKVYYKVGYNSGSLGLYDYDNNIIQSSRVVHDDYDVDYSRLNLKNITSNEVTIDFKYSTTDSPGLLEEINIKDINGNYITGYKFIYNSQADGVIWRILKYDKNKVNTIILYEFEYFDEPGYFINNYGYIDDHFGYCNDVVFNTNTMPYQIRNSPTVVLPKSDPTPNIEYAKFSSLKKIKNKFGGLIEFDYQLKNENHNHFGLIYGGGLLISSKKITPNIGNQKIITYQYQELSGFLVLQNSINHHYIKNYNGNKFYLQNPLLDEINELTYGNSMFLPNIHKIGNYFKSISEIEYNYDDYLNTGTWNSRVLREYNANYEGIYRRPLLVKEQYFTPEGCSKTIEFLYSCSNIETIDRGIFTFESRSSNGRKYVKTKIFDPIKINRVQLVQKKEIYPMYNHMEKSENYDYQNTNTKSLKKINSLSSDGILIERNYYYSNDSQMALEPLVTDLINKNFTGTSLKTETFVGIEKISEEKTVFAKDASTNNLLLPKFIYAKKGADFQGNNLEKKITYNSYDLKGNITQYTNENGIPVSMVWGYNNTMLIAKIENIAYSNIPLSLITTAQNASNINNNESNLIIALDAIRNNGTLANAFVTTFTYNPSIGVSSVTDSKGDKITYTYDSFNRLKWVKDKNGNILSENQYNYKP